MSGFEAFLWSLTMQESGGNYRAVGPPTPYGRAYGRYQVLAPNIGPWTAKYYGRRLSANEFLNNSRAQDAVVRGVLGGYYKRYGARGAAAMWYSGQPNPNKTYGNPPVYSYVNSVTSRMSRWNGQRLGGGGGGGGGSPSTSRSVGGAVPVKLSSSELAERYGLTSRLINSSKELKSLFNKAVAGQWSSARFQAGLKNTNWWRKQPSSLRKYVTRKYTDPATHSQAWSNGRMQVNSWAVEMGLGDQISKGKSSRLLKEATYNKLALGWSDARIKDWLGRRAVTHDGQMWGEAGEVFDKLHEMAYLNGLRYSKEWYADRTRDVIGGRSTIETQEAKIRAAAASRFVNFREQIKAGQNAIDLAAPYIKSVSQILELPESDVDLFDKHVISAMTGGKAGQNFPLWEFERMVRKDARWKKTNNAREGIMTVAHQVAKDFGMAS